MKTEKDLIFELEKEEVWIIPNQLVHLKILLWFSMLHEVSIGLLQFLYFMFNVLEIIVHTFKKKK